MSDQDDLYTKGEQVLCDLVSLSDAKDEEIAELQSKVTELENSEEEKDGIIYDLKAEIKALEEAVAE